MHHNGIHFFPLPAGGSSSTHGLLAVNHKYTDDGLLHVGRMEPWTPEKVRKSQAAVNIQHPGESSSERANPAAPTAIGAWPDGPGGGRPHSATVAIRKQDGGVIGA